VGQLPAIGSAWLASLRTPATETVVTYSRPGTPPASPQTVTVAATPGKTEFDIENSVGVVERFVSRDYTITRIDLVLGGVVVEPQSGDQITEIANGATCVYEVMLPGGKGDCWRWSDQYHNSIRVHTKQVQ
jgi:hypothetical protein